MFAELNWSCPRERGPLSREWHPRSAADPLEMIMKNQLETPCDLKKFTSCCNTYQPIACHKIEKGKNRFLYYIIQSRKLPCSYRYLLELEPCIGKTFLDLYTYTLILQNWTLISTNLKIRENLSNQHLSGLPELLKTCLPNMLRQLRHWDSVPKVSGSNLRCGPFFYLCQILSL